ncbi:hypothetical protein FGIG_02698, partial [Fasciola gigantica]
NVYYIVILISCRLVQYSGPSDKEYKAVCPRHWDRTRSQSLTDAKTCLSMENLRIAETQPEYWWRQNPSTADCFRSVCLDARGTADVRNELTEYQIIREVVWALLGGRASYIFRTLSDSDKLLNNRFILCDRASLATTSIEALDALLTQFARSASHGLLLRTLVDHVFRDGLSSLHPCVLAFASGINNYVSQLDHYLHELQNQSRGPSCFTLANLYVRILPWSRRTGILAGLVMQITAGRFDQLRCPTVHIQILDVIYYVMTTFDVCTDDRTFLNILQSLFLQTFYPFLHTTVHLLSGAASVPEYLYSLFADPEVQLEPTHPDYWSQSFTWHGVDHSSLSRIPRFFHPVLSELMHSIKALCMIIALVNQTGDNQILQNVLMKSEDIFNLIHIPPSPVQSNSIVMKLPRVDTPTSQTVHSYPDDDDFIAFRRELIQWTKRNKQPIQCENSDSGVYNAELMDSLRTNLHSFIRSRCDTVNRYLVSVLLSSPRIVTPGFQYLGTALAAVGSVYLFGAGDRLNDFARDLFQCIRSSEPWYRDHIGLTLQLRDQFEYRTAPMFLKYVRNTFSFQPTPESLIVQTDGAAGSLSDQFQRVRLCFNAEWPATVILNEEVLNTYNAVFTFLLQIKYVKWLLEALRFVDIHWLLKQDGVTYHRLLLLRSSMIFVFAGLHDFLVHRIEALRIHFIQYWNLPDVMQIIQASEQVDDRPGDLSHLIATHHSMLTGLKAVCLLTSSSAILRRELGTVLQLPLVLQSLWSPNLIVSGSSDIDARVTHLIDTFHTHVNFLASLLSTSVRISNMRKLSSLAETFRIAASFRI